MSAPTSPPPGLPTPAYRLLAAVGALALGLTAALLAIAGRELNLLGVVALACGIAIGEACKIGLPFRRGGTVTFSLSDTALTVGLLLLGGLEVVVAGAMAMLLWQLVERLSPLKIAFNVAQYVAGFAAAALLVELIAPRPGPLAARALAAAAAGVLCLMIINTVAVGGMIAITSGHSLVGVVRRLMPTALLLVVGNLCLGLLVVVVVDAHLWALPAVAVPIVLLHRASRGEVRAQVGRERAQAHLGIEQRLSEAMGPAAVASILADGVADLLGVAAAVWSGDRWMTPAPTGSGPCPIDADLSTTISSVGPVLGPATGTPCAAIGLGSGVLVVWGTDLALDDDAREWLERMGRSGRVHLARAGAAEALAKEQATLRAVVDGTADGICVLDASGAVRVWNPAMAAIARVPAEDALGRPAAAVLGDGPWTDDGIHDVVRSDDRVWRVAVSSPEDRTSGARQVAVVHDVSAERRVARMKDDMLAVVSHELRTPLTPIKASAQLLLLRWDRLTVDQREELLTQVTSSADHLNRLVNDILLVAQLSESGTAQPRVELEAADVSAAVAEAADTLRLTHPGHVLRVDVPGQLVTLTDSLRLRQIIDNLVTNACKFSPAGSAVDLALTRSDNQMVLTVQDRGRGIPAEHLARVFERFERVEDPLVMTTSGAGLGLYIVRELAEALGGTVALRSEPGMGTTAEVRMPLFEAPLPRHAHTARLAGRSAAPT